MSVPTSVDSWYALEVRSRYEKSVHSHLAREGYEAFLPLSREWHRWADRTKLVELPLFPGYLFCRFEPLRTHPVFKSPGVMGVVRIGNAPATVDSAEIEALQRAQMARLPFAAWPELLKGQRVIMSNGPLTGLHGTVVEIRRTLRLVLSVTLLQRCVLVEIDRDWATPVASAGSAGSDAMQNSSDDCRKSA